MRNLLDALKSGALNWFAGGFCMMGAVYSFFDKFWWGIGINLFTSTINILIALWLFNDNKR